MASTSKSSKSIKHSIEKFCSITGATKEVAKKMLDACEGNLEMAINMHVDASEANAATDDRMSPALKPAAEFYAPEFGDDNVRAPIPPTRGVLVEEPFSFGVHARRKPARSIFDGFRDFEAETKRQEQELCNPSNSQNRNKRQTLEDLFRPPLDLMHKGTFDTARELGQSLNKWIMVNVQNVQEFACQILNRDVWSNQSVKRIIEQHFVFFQIYHDSEEGLRYMQFYKVVEWPYIAIIDPRTGENLIVWNKIDAVSFCDLVNEFLSSHQPLDGVANPVIPPKKKQKIDSIVDASEDSQLEAAIQASLRETARLQRNDDSEYDSNEEVETFESDNEASVTSTNNQENENSRCSSSNTVKIIDDGSDRKKEADSTEENDKETGLTGKNDKDLEVTNENCNQHTSEKVKENDTNDEVENNCENEKKSWKSYLGDEQDVKSKLVLRFPDGKKEQLSLPSTSKIKALLLYVESLHFSNGKYELVTNFPRRQLSQINPDLTLKEVGLFPQETIFIQAR